MKVEEVIKVLTEFNKWRRGEPPYDWNEDPSLMIEFPFDVKEVGEAIDEAINMLKHADDMEREEKRETKYEYPIKHPNGNVMKTHEDEIFPIMPLICKVVRRSVGEWEEVSNG